MEQACLGGLAHAHATAPRNPPHLKVFSFSFLNVRRVSFLNVHSFSFLSPGRGALGSGRQTLALNPKR
eukprot:364451-Chlamydomonas_euryale.AAC.14